MSFLGREDEESNEPIARDPRAYPMSPPRVKGAAKVLIEVEDVELVADGVEARVVKPAAPVKAEPIRQIQPIQPIQPVDPMEPVEPVAERAFRAGVVEALRGKRLQLSPSQRAAQRAAAVGVKVTEKDAGGSGDA
jgi:hypothetical protein